jgi:hypothetical protein
MPDETTDPAVQAAAAAQSADPASPSAPRVEPPSKPGTVPLVQHTVPLHQRVNVWRFQAKDKDGAIVESSPGMTHFEFRGPTSKKEVIEAAALFFGNHRLDAMRAGLDDPGYAIDESTIEPAGNAPQTATDIGTRRPEVARPIQMPNADIVAENNARVIEEGRQRLGL